MMAEFAACYHGEPSADMKWPLFLALVERAPRFDARQMLTFFDAVRAAIGSAFGGDKVEAHRARERLIRRAYPVKRERQQIVRDEGTSDG